MLIFLFEEVGAEALARGLAERAACLLGALMRLVDAGELPRPAAGDTEYAEFLSSVREALGEAEAGRAMARGRELTLEPAGPDAVAADSHRG